MDFTKGARYQYESYQTDASTGQKVEATERSRTWTVVQEAVVVQGRSNVAIFVDSVFNAGVFVNVSDSIYLSQAPGSNDVYRFASLAPELDLSGVAVLDLGREWMHEARLNASTASWFVGSIADTIEYETGIPGVNKVRIAVTDSAVASAAEDLSIDGQTYKTTKTTHKLELSISVIVDVPVVGPTAFKLKSASLNRTTWMAPSLGAIVKEVREGTVINVNEAVPGLPGGGTPNFSIPVPGYYSAMVKVLATGK
jgi:hypothetical protein